MGNPLNAVFAASTRISVVKPWTAKKPTVLLPNTAAESCASTVRCS